MPSPSAASCSGVSSVRRGLAWRPGRALVRNGSGQPPGGSPSSPLRKPMTESGMSYFCGSSSKSAGSAPAPTSASARSPTTLDDGVTLTTLPRMRLAAAYMSSISSNRSPRPRAMACWRRLRQLAAGDLVEVDPTGGGVEARLEGPVEAAHGLPVGLEREDARRCRGPVGRSVSSVAATSADSDGWLVVPAIVAVAASTASTPASMAASRVPIWPPAVSWVCRCTGRSKRSRSAAHERAPRPERAAGRPCP